MPWRVMKLRDQRVFARCDDTGDLRVEGGRVEIRYKPNDGRAYRAGARNLEPIAGGEVLPDSACGDAEAADPGKKGKKAQKTKKATGPLPSTNQPGQILVYADGACSGNPGPAGAGVVRIDDDGRRELSEFLGEGTNNIAELTALLRAFESVDDPSTPLRVYTDSSYAIGLLTKGWKAKKNKELVAKLREALGRLQDVELHHVPGHAGVPLNERADELAVEAVRSRSSSGWRTL